MNQPMPALAALLIGGLAATAGAAEFTGIIVDAETQRPLAARVYLEDAEGNWLFVESASEQGSALAYREQWVPMPDSVERHTTVSAHPFRIQLPPGRFRLTIERGKEYLPLVVNVAIAEQPVVRTFRLRRWINLAERGWYSGETHVHRRPQELPNVMLAEDLNVAFPVTFWTVQSGVPPGLDPSPLRRQGPSPWGARRDLGSDMISIDATHVYFPRNTEYEIFFQGQRRHTLGAVFVLNHKSVFQAGMPPVKPIADLAHKEGALLDLDKHSWPWAMMLVPVAKIDLYELANNSLWRTTFGFRRSAVPPAPYMKVEEDAGGLTEWGWLQFGFQNYYTLLNCGFQLQPTAGTASGVHPVPLGYSRVYVHTGTGFDPQAWLRGLGGGRSFVTTGPMLFVRVNGKLPGERFARNSAHLPLEKIEIEAVSHEPLERVELIVNGAVVETVYPGDDRRRIEHQTTIRLSRSSWLVVRCLQRGADRRVRFAHTAPWHFRLDDRPLQPAREEIDYLISRIEQELERNRDVLGRESLREYEQALEVYQSIRRRARPAGG